MSNVSICCVICLEEFPKEDARLMQLPCCEVTARSTNSGLCHGCFEQLLSISSFSGFARCPFCRCFLQPTASGAVVACNPLSPCASCNQLRVLVEQNYCDACVLGRRFCFSYECERCHGHAMIPHPMWRYQPTSRDFGNVTWACQRCADYTHWRLDARLVHRVPLDDMPLSWEQERREAAQRPQRDAIPLRRNEGAAWWRDTFCLAMLILLAWYAYG